jgi:hypothetical protein
MTAAERLIWRDGDIEITRALTVKAEWDESQHPRDEDGRFTTGVGSERELYESGASPQIDHRWFDAYFAATMRETLAKPLPPVSAGLGDTGPFLGMTGAQVADFHRAAVDIVNKINAAPPTSTDIYRGIGLQDKDYAALQADLAPGKTVDLNLASWSTSQHVATDFAANKFGTVPGAPFAGSSPHMVVFDVAAGAHALDIHGAAPDFQQFARETLTAGRFTVTSVDHVEEYEPRGEYMPTSTLDTVHLQQVATLDPDQLIGTKVEQLTEPPHFLPWLEAYFNHRMVPPKESK